MINISKNKIAVILALILLIGAVLTVNFAVDNNAYAATANYFTPEQYTDSDELLNSDGTVNDNRTIVDFAADVKAAKAGTSFPELAKVIPRQYLESTETNAVYAYSGREYGLIIA